MMIAQPRIPIEEMIAQIWMEVLKLEQVGIHDNFFELGGDSLRATQVISRVLHVFQSEPLQDTVELEGMLLNVIFEQPTVAAIAEALERAQGAAQGLQAPPILPVSQEGHIPISFAQTLWWLPDQLEPGNPAFNDTVAIRLTGSLNISALHQSFSEIVRRHEALRTTFAMVDGVPVQVIHPTLTVPLPVIDLESQPESKRELEALRLATEEAQRSFDLGEGPLLRTTLLRLRKQEHVLVLTMHAIISDGWSVGVLFRELSILYEAFSTGRPSPLPELPIQYADFVAWQRQWLQGKVLEDLLAYWRQQLGGELPMLELPTDRPRPAVETFQGATQGIVLPKSLTDALKALSRREGVTLFMMLLAAFKTLLYRYTGQDDILVGTPIANRTRVELEGLIGCFATPLVMRTDLSCNPSFQELLTRVRDIALGAYIYQNIPFERLVEDLQPERDMSRTPLLQVIFILQYTPSSPPNLPGLSVQPLEIHNGTAKFDLTLDLSEATKGIKGRFEYNIDLFDDTTIARMARYFQTLLEGIVADPEQHLSDLPLLTEAERHQILAEWNDTQTDYPKGLCIHELFEAQAERTPNAVAVVFEDEELTYEELNQRANQLAHHLRSLGVGLEVLVGICMERSLEMVIGILGILKAGGAYVPLDPTYPKERLAYMLEDTRPSVVVTKKGAVESLPEHRTQVVCLDTDWGAITQESIENPISHVTADNLAYVIYTSGSTGKPKGVLAIHRGAINRFTWMWRSYPFEIEEVCCQMTSLNFVDSVWEILGPLLQGIRTVIIADDVVEDLAQLIQALARDNITRIVLVPSLLRVILDTYDDLQKRLPKLRIWVTSGEALSGNLAQRFREIMSKSVLLNLYGSSEVCADVTWYDTYLDSTDLASIPIGCPISNTQVYILDRYLQPVPVGVSGELCIGGESLARGYLHRPDLTAEQFIPNPFNDEPGARLYKTGDLARYRPDGAIEFLGRIDYQVKIRGIRIEPGEIEAVLQEHPSVQESVVIAREDVPGNKYLAAYVVPYAAQASAVSELRRFLKERLPEYMIPFAFVMLEALPLTPNKKVDRRALPAPSRTSPEDTYVAPRNQLERTIADIWQELLGLERVGIHDNFFELGGHSLLATQLVLRLSKIFQIELPLRSLFKAPTVADLAMEVVEKQTEQVDSETLKQILGNIKQLSQEEVRIMLEAERGITHEESSDQ